jgi:hypothetical protein
MTLTLLRRVAGPLRASRRQEGQVMILFLIFSPVLVIFMMAFVLDVGRGYREKRALVACSDAAALAGAQVLPDRAAAWNLATEYAQKNCTGGPGADGRTATVEIVFPPNSIKVYARKTIETTFARAFGQRYWNVKATAVARLAGVGYAGPLAVRDTSVVLHEDRTFTPRLLSVDGRPASQVSPAVLADWITDPSVSMTPGVYPTVTSALLGNSQVRAALDDLAGELICLPEYDAGGAVVAWVDFQVESYNGSAHTITGTFWEQGESINLVQ